MNAIAFLRDWKRGDTLSADELNTIPNVIAMLEAAEPGGGGGAAIRGGMRRLSDGPLEMPWQAYMVQADKKLEARVVPGVVLVGGWNGAEHATQLATLPTGAEVVQDFEPAEACTIWLELTGEVEVQMVSQGVTTAGLITNRYQRAALKNAALRVTCEPSDDALRVWALAAYNPAHSQRVTQLLWGDLSALECRGLLDSSGAVVWPQDRDSAAGWNSEAHRNGMATLCECDFSREDETVTGVLSGCIDEDGALELFLGPTEEEEAGETEEEDDSFNGDGDNGGGGSSGGDSGGGSSGGDDNDSDPYPDYDPVHPDPNNPPSRPTRVRYGYVAGEGFKSCTLCNKEGENGLYWKLVLDGDFLAKLCEELKASGNVTFTGGGSSYGVWATITMSLGDCSASASGVGASGSASLLFAGTHGSTGTGSATAKITFSCTPRWTQSQTWLLSADELHDAGAFVIREKGQYTGDGFVEANHWYRFRVKKSAFRKQAQNFFAAQMAAIGVSDSDSSSSGGATVSGSLSGTILNPTFSLTLS